VVTFSVRSETDAKHAFALGQTSTAPPTASLSVYDPSVPAPAATDWALAGATLTANGASVAAIVATGLVGNQLADAAIWDVRLPISGAGAEDNWVAAGIDAPTLSRKEFTGLTPQTSYEVSVRYRVRGVIGARRILGPATSGDSALDGYAAMMISQSSPTDADPLDGLIQATSSTITIETHARTYSDKVVSVTGGSLTVDDTGAALVASVTGTPSVYHVYYDDAGRAGGAVVVKATNNATDAANTPAHPARHYVGSITMDIAGGTGTTGGGALPPGWQYDNWWY
jgi:hypothetical protein